jgi:hypothetical protein
MPAPASEPPKPVVYKIGDKGPAGGIIFYDKGDNSGGWRYLEAAPKETEFKAEWGVDISVNGTSVEVGSGKENTRLITAESKKLEQQYKKNGEIVRAVRVAEEAVARRCTELNINGYADWFLPSKSDLGWMYVNLKRKGLGGFGDDWYWSSSQIRSDVAWPQEFSNGFQDGRSKDITFSVRAVRAF